MLRWTILFLIVALIAALLGFGGIAAGPLPLLRFCSLFSSYYSSSLFYLV